MKKVICLNCKHEFNYAPIVGKLTGTVIGGLITGQSPGKAMIGMGIGWMFGHILDLLIVETISPKCPECGFVIEGIIDAMKDGQ